MSNDIYLITQNKTKKIAIIYRATNQVSRTKKCYIGITTQTLQDRIKRHLWDAKRGSEWIFHRSIRKNGEKNFDWEILAETDDEDYARNFLETQYIKENESFWKENGYNMTFGGEGPRGFHHSENSKKKMSASAKKRGVTLTEKGRKSISENSLKRWDKESKRPTKDILEQLYIKEEKTALEISKIYGVNGGTVGRWLKKYGIPLDPGRVFRKSVPPKEILQKLYIKDCLRLRDIADIYKVGMMTVRNWLLNNDIPTRNRGNKTSKIPLDKSTKT
jgi:group I intron endonuclease